MKKVLIISGIIIVIIIALVITGISLVSGWGSDINEFEHLKSPQISVKTNQRVIVVEVTGDPNKSGNKELGVLFRMYYKLKTANKNMKMAAPRARWPKDFDTPKDQWVGIWAMPIFDNITMLPDIKSNVPIKIDTWEYGGVGEILHIGPYSDKMQSIEKLRKFIKDNGYNIIGFHEEEYIKSPGIFFKGNPKNYLTIIRYRVKK